MAEKTRKDVETLMAARNVIPYCWRDVIDDQIYWREPLLEAFVGILEAGNKHPNWNTGEREGTIITLPLKNVVLTRKDITKDDSKKDIDSDYVSMTNNSVHCPIICMGRGSYGLFSVHRGRAGFLYESIKRAFETYVPKERWSVKEATGQFSIDGLEIAGMLSESFHTRFYEYTIEMGFLHVEKNKDFYDKVYEGIPGFGHELMGSLMGLFPEVDIYAFFESIYNSLDEFSNS